MGRVAVALVVWVWPLLACAQPSAATIQSLNDVAFVAGHAALSLASGQRTAPWRLAPLDRLAGDGVRGAAGGPAVREADAMDVRLSRWPAAVSARVGAVGFSVSPEVGVGVGGAGAGATVTVSSVGAILKDKLEALGVKDGSAVYGGQGRLYLFAAVHGQAVGLNLQRDGGALRGAGWSTDVSSALVGDGQVGVGWRKGGVEAAIGYVHRGVRLQNAPLGAADSYADDMAAFSLTFHPRW